MSYVGLKRPYATKKASKRKVVRKRPKRRRTSRPTAKALDRALRQLKRSVSVTVSSADSVLAAAEAIVSLAAARTKEQLLQSLLDDNILAALHGLPRRDEETSSVLRMHSRWLRDHFNVEPIYEHGEQLEVPAERLAAFDLIGRGPEETRGICSITIVAAGWKQGNKVLRKPVASITEGTLSRSFT
jgi:hypothetical protein